jgi:hypothetical protein
MDDDDESELEGHHAYLPSTQNAFGAECRRQLLLFNRERIEFAYVKARANGLDDPVILVLDLQDDRAALLAHRTGLPWETIEQLREECDRCDAVPTQVISAPRWAVMCTVGPMSPNSPHGIARPCADGAFRVVAIAAGGNSFADFPLPPTSNLAEG